MAPRRSLAAKLFVFWLLLLAVSPVTAPFSTSGLLELLSGNAGPGVAAQSKKGGEPHAAVAATGVDLHVVIPDGAAAQASRALTPDTRRLLDLPLRI